MIYLFDRLYLESDHSIGNDADSLIAILGPTAVEAMDCDSAKYDFPNLQLDVTVDNNELANYLQNLVVKANGARTVLYTNDDNFIRILAFYCGSIFKNPTVDFVKSLILIDKTWIDTGTGYAGSRDFALRNKGFDSLDTTNIDAMIAEGLSITNKLAPTTDLRLEYVFASYLNKTLSAAQVASFKGKIREMFYDSNWQGQLIKNIAPMMITFLAKKGVDLDTFTTDTLREHLPEYFRIFDVSIYGSATCFDQVELSDWMAFLDQCTADFGWTPQQSLLDLYHNFYADKQGFIDKHCLDPANISKYYCTFDLGKTIKVNPYLWNAIAAHSDNKNYLDQFNLNV